MTSTLSLIPQLAKNCAKKEVRIKHAYSVGLHISTLLSGTVGFHHAKNQNIMILNCVVSLSLSLSLFLLHIEYF